MNKLYAFWAVLLFCVSSAFAQDQDKLAIAFTQDSILADKLAFEVQEQPILDKMQLGREKWYYSLEEAKQADPSKVYKLSLQGQKLKEIPAEVFSFPNLQVLNLSENKIKSVSPEIGRLTHLQVVNLYDNKLRSMPAELQELRELHSLFISNNQLIEIPVWVGGFGKLRTFDISYNHLTRKEAEAVQNALPKCVVTHGFDREPVQD